MGVDVPALDDRSYEALLEDVRKRIPIADEDWTDHNAHDPGITILELLTWLSESYRYQLDQIEDRHRRKYAQLLGFTPALPKPATAIVRVTPDESVVGDRVPEGTRLLADDGRTERPFETIRSTTLTGASVAVVVADTGDGRTDHSSAARSEGTYFRAFGPTASAGSTLYLGFEGDPFADPTAPLSLYVDAHEANLPEPAEHGDEAVTFEPSVELAWEYCTDYRAWESANAWHELEVLTDTTDALYGSGFVTLAHPGGDRWRGVDHHSPGVLEAGEGYAWLRVRLTTAGYEIPPQFDRVRTNVLPVAHRVNAGPERLSRSDGAEETSTRPNQRFEFDHAPVLGATVTVGGERWEPVEDFDESGPDDDHYVLDASAGAIRFGDNVRGAVPAAGQVVEATSYEYGGGPAGNVPATSDWSFAQPTGTTTDGTTRDGGTHGPDWAASPAVRGADVASMGAASGGRAAETVEDALAHLRRDLERPYRAVTAEDCEYVARHTPGLRFGRAHAVVEDGTSPGDCVDHDAVRVVVVPYSPPSVDRPTPSEGFLDAVQCHLERHRLVTDRITATAPTYVDVGVRVEVELTGGTVAGLRREAVEDALDRFLSPLRGFDGGGWPFGRPVYYSELYERVRDVEGVDCVVDVDVDAGGEATVTDDAVEIPDVALVAPAEHTVVVRDTGRRCGEVR